MTEPKAPEELPEVRLRLEPMENGGALPFALKLESVDEQTGDRYYAHCTGAHVVLSGKLPQREITAIENWMHLLAWLERQKTVSPDLVLVINKCFSKNGREVYSPDNLKSISGYCEYSFDEKSPDFHTKGVVISEDIESYLISINVQDKGVKDSQTYFLMLCGERLGIPERFALSLPNDDSWLISQDFDPSFASAYARLLGPFGCHKDKIQPLVGPLVGSEYEVTRISEIVLTMNRGGFEQLKRSVEKINSAKDRSSQQLALILAEDVYKDAFNSESVPDATLVQALQALMIKHLGKFFRQVGLFVNQSNFSSNSPLPRALDRFPKYLEPHLAKKTLIYER